jgi:hypothetical protein
MSVRTRPLWIIPAVLMASWLAVRSLGAVPAARDLDDPPRGSAGAQISDAALASLIAGFAADARR